VQLSFLIQLHLIHLNQPSNDDIFNLNKMELQYVLFLEAICVTLWIAGIAFGIIYLYISKTTITKINDELDDVLIRSQ